jgi:hypothetical protein
MKSSDRWRFPLWHNRDYLLLWFGQTISSIGSGVSELAFPLLVLALTHSPAQADSPVPSERCPNLFSHCLEERSSIAGIANAS